MIDIDQGGSEIEPVQFGEQARTACADDAFAYLLRRMPAILLPGIVNRANLDFYGSDSAMPGVMGLTQRRGGGELRRERKRGM